MGKVKESSDQTRYLVMKARYGLNPVRLRVSVLTGNSRLGSSGDSGPGPRRMGRCKPTSD
jgi:hypothetical protein